MPRLKQLHCAASADRLVVSLDPRRRVRLDDPNGDTRLLLELLAEGSRDLDELVVEVRSRRPHVTDTEVRTAVAGLDELGWVEDAGERSRFDATERERYFSNLAFFDGFTSLGRGREDLQHRMRTAHVLVLGAGGLGSAAIQHLVGMGVGRLTIVDFDVVEPRNFARQYAFTPAATGRSKVVEVAGWVRAFDPSVEVSALHRRIDGVADVSELLAGVNLVVHAIDQPVGIDQIVNQACVAARVPYVRGGLAYLQGLYWSVDPGRSACRACLELQRERELAGNSDHVVRWPVVLEQARVNRAIGPVAGMLGSLVAMEALRYLTRVVEPVAAGTYQLIDFTTDCHIRSESWPREPECPVCAPVGA